MLKLQRPLLISKRWPRSTSAKRVPDTALWTRGQRRRESHLRIQESPHCSLNAGDHRPETLHLHLC